MIFSNWRIIRLYQIIFIELNFCQMISRMLNNRISNHLQYGSINKDFFNFSTVWFTGHATRLDSLRIRNVGGQKNEKKLGELIEIGRAWNGLNCIFIL